MAVAGVSSCVVLKYTFFPSLQLRARYNDLKANVASSVASSIVSFTGHVLSASACATPWFVKFTVETLFIIGTILAQLKLDGS